LRGTPSHTMSSLAQLGCTTSSNCWTPLPPLRRGGGGKGDTGAFRRRRWSSQSAGRLAPCRATRAGVEYRASSS
jgi:hypothetical protein